MGLGHLGLGCCCAPPSLCPGDCVFHLNPPPQILPCLGTFGDDDWPRVCECGNQADFDKWGIKNFYGYSTNAGGFSLFQDCDSGYIPFTWNGYMHGAHEVETPANMGSSFTSIDIGTRIDRKLYKHHSKFFTSQCALYVSDPVANQTPYTKSFVVSPASGLNLANGKFGANGFEGATSARYLTHFSGTGMLSNTSLGSYQKQSGWTVVPYAYTLFDIRTCNQGPGVQVAPDNYSLATWPGGVVKITPLWCLPEGPSRDLFKPSPNPMTWFPAAYHGFVEHDMVVDWRIDGFVTFYHKIRWFDVVRYGAVQEIYQDEWGTTRINRYLTAPVQEPDGSYEFTNTRPWDCINGVHTPTGPLGAAGRFLLTGIDGSIAVPQHPCALYYQTLEQSCPLSSYGAIPYKGQIGHWFGNQYPIEFYDFTNIRVDRFSLDRTD